MSVQALPKPIFIQFVRKSGDKRRTFRSRPNLLAKEQYQFSSVTPYDATFHRQNADLVAKSVQSWFEFVWSISVQLAKARIKKWSSHWPQVSWNERIAAAVFLTWVCSSHGFLEHCDRNLNSRWSFDETLDLKRPREDQTSTNASHNNEHALKARKPFLC